MSQNETTEWKYSPEYKAFLAQMERERVDFEGIREGIRLQRLAKMVETGTAYATAAVLLVAVGFLLASPARPWFGFVAAGIAAGDLLVAMVGTLLAEWFRRRADKI